MAKPHGPCQKILQVFLQTVSNRKTRTVPSLHRENFSNSICPSDGCRLLLLLLCHAGQGLTVLLRSNYIALAPSGTSWSGVPLQCGQAGSCSQWLWRDRSCNLKDFGHRRKEVDVLEGSADGNNGGILDKTVFCDNTDPNAVVYVYTLCGAKWWW